ncbi:MAG: hypothetical protein ICV51_23100 [Flavisolibacter sp.]|nr:hypothetical protein [Flavisolibacter sp.]
MCYLRTALPFIILFHLLLFKNQLQAQQQVIDSQFHYLRNGIKPEWKEFARVVPQRQLTLYFTTQANEKEQTLRLRQYDVNQRWKVLLNDHALGTLTVDENDMITYLVIPAGTLLTGSNKLQIEPSDIESDDIRIGPIQLYNLPLNELLSEASITIEVVDKNHQQTIPARITIVNHEHALQTVGAATNNTLAVRPGFVYTGSGKAVFGLPAGTYTIYATRGFEYGVDSAKIIVKRGDQLHRKFVIRREVPTDGWVSSDTHIHTLTYSKHGDATIEERALTIAGEGIELPITTEHNITTDLKAVAKKMNVSAYFTPVMGMEWTTSVGH